MEQGQMKKKYFSSIIEGCSIQEPTSYRRVLDFLLAPQEFCKENALFG
jgi:hypothetical protein